MVWATQDSRGGREVMQVECTTPLDKAPIVNNFVLHRTEHIFSSFFADYDVNEKRRCGLH